MQMLPSLVLKYALKTVLQVRENTSSLKNLIAHASFQKTINYNGERKMKKTPNSVVFFTQLSIKLFHFLTKSKRKSKYWIRCLETMQQRVLILK